MKRNFKGLSGVTIALIIAIILLIALGVFFAVGKKSAAPSSSTSKSSANTQVTQGPTQALAGGISATTQDIIGRGQNLECDWHMPESMGPSSQFGTGKLYTSGNEGRSMISGTASGMTIDGNAIYKNGDVYSWVAVGGTTMGFKFTKEKLAELNSQMTPEQEQVAEQIRAKMIFSCKSWTPDESKFVLPSGVEFK